MSLILSLGIPVGVSKNPPDQGPPTQHPPREMIEYSQDTSTWFPVSARDTAPPVPTSPSTHGEAYRTQIRSLGLRE